MSNTYTWTVTSMSTLPNVPNQPNYVVLVKGQITGSNDATPPVIASTEYSVALTVDENQSNYIPYDQLTESVVIGWVQTTLTPEGVSNLEANVDGQINSIVNPPVSPSSQALPWAS